MNKRYILFLKDAQSKGLLKYTENLPLSSVSSIGIGGRARFYVTPYTAYALTETVKSAEDCGIKYEVVGNLTNVLFSDCGYDGAIITARKINMLSVSDGSIYAECGVTLPALSAKALECSYTGFEGLVSIPATVGGALITNAGAFGCEIADCLRSFSVYLPKEDRTEVRTPESHPFSYRKSCASDGGAIVLCATFSAMDGDRGDISEKMLQNREKRRLSQPINAKSVGSFFKRPDYAKENRDVSFLYYGKSAGELIDLCGLKGKRVGDAAVSEKHAGFIINLGKATFSDVQALSEEIKQTVYQRTGVRLFEECVKMI